MTRTVYCFNAFNEPIGSLNVNGLQAGTVPAWSSAAGPTIYTPSSLAVPRVRHGDGQTQAAFPNDTPTGIMVEWDTFTATTTINIAQYPDVSLDDDLILYFAANLWTLMTARGYVLDSHPYQQAAKTAPGAGAPAGQPLR